MISDLAVFAGAQPARVLILYNGPILPPGHPDADSERDILFTVATVEQALTDAGFEVSRLGLQREPAVLLSRVKKWKPDVVFNLFEGLADDGETEAHVAGLLEWLELPYTGCAYQTLSVARRKHLTKLLFQGAGLPTAPFFTVAELPVPENTLGWPVIVKPATEDASVGLDQGSVVKDQKKLDERVESLLETYAGSVLVEQFIRGREFNAAVIEVPDLRVLPVSEILFTDPSPDFWPIVTYDAKWKPGSRDYESTPPKCPADVAPRLRTKLERLATAAFHLLGCRDYARVDFRVSATGKPYILEVNPNPDFSLSAGFANGLRSAGLTHAGFTVDLVRRALSRGKKAADEVTCETAG